MPSPLAVSAPLTARAVASQRASSHLESSAGAVTDSSMSASVASAAAATSIPHSASAMAPSARRSISPRSFCTRGHWCRRSGKRDRLAASTLAYTSPARTKRSAASCSCPSSRCPHTFSGVSTMNLIRQLSAYAASRSFASASASASSPAGVAMAVAAAASSSSKQLCVRAAAAPASSHSVPMRTMLSALASNSRYDPPTSSRSSAVFSPISTRARASIWRTSAIERVSSRRSTLTICESPPLAGFVAIATTMASALLG
mmetsp:Transcript_9055/g.37063  ORF Transcript_9055/g.37063 Transcript_9055/m.37063 type:complete len:259 (+) Transcript_9055:4272-5048(+)